MSLGSIIAALNIGMAKAVSLGQNIGSVAKLVTQLMEFGLKTGELVRNVKKSWATDTLGVESATSISTRDGVVLSEMPPTDEVWHNFLWFEKGIISDADWRSKSPERKAAILKEWEKYRLAPYSYYTKNSFRADGNFR